MQLLCRRISYCQSSISSWHNHGLTFTIFVMYFGFIPRQKLYLFPCSFIIYLTVCLLNCMHLLYLITFQLISFHNFCDRHYPQLYVGIFSSFLLSIVLFSVMCVKSLPREYKNIFLTMKHFLATQYETGNHFYELSICFFDFTFMNVLMSLEN